MPKFSIITPQYNSFDLMDEYFKSLESQTFKDFEVIIVDDCSTDDSYEKLQEYVKGSSLNIRLLQSRSNQGPGNARNLGVEVAKGEWIAFADSDDRLDDNYFQTISDSTDGAPYDLVYIGNYHVIGSLTKLSPDIIANTKDDFIATASGALWRFIFKRELLNRVSIPTLRNAEDIAVIPLLINYSQRILYLNKRLYYYIHRNSSISSSKSKTVTDNFLKSFEFTLAKWEGIPTKALEFHGIKTIMYGAILNGVKAGLSKREILKIIRDFEQKFPVWYENPYLNQYSKPKKVFLKVVKHKWWLGLRMFAWLHTRLLKSL